MFDSAVHAPFIELPGPTMNPWKVGNYNEANKCY